MTVIFFFQAEDGIRDGTVTGVQTCALPISHGRGLVQKLRLLGREERDEPVVYQGLGRRERRRPTISQRLQSEPVHQRKHAQGDASAVPDHWVVMASPILSSTIHNDPTATVSATVYTWGGVRDVHENSSQKMTVKQFLGNFYGYVAAKP